MQNDLKKLIEYANKINLSKICSDLKFLKIKSKKWPVNYHGLSDGFCSNSFIINNKKECDIYIKLCDEKIRSLKH